MSRMTQMGTRVMKVRNRIEFHFYFFFFFPLLLACVLFGARGLWIGTRASYDCTGQIMWISLVYRRVGLHGRQYLSSIVIIRSRVLPGNLVKFP